MKSRPRSVVLFQGLTVLFVGTMGLVGNVLAFATILSMSRPLREDLYFDPNLLPSVV